MPAGWLAAAGSPGHGSDRAREWRQRAEAAEARIQALTRALECRPAIEQAKGVLIAVFGLAPDAAFEVLVWVSQQTNHKLADVAERFVHAARSTEFSATTREQVTDLLGELVGRLRTE